MTRKNCVPVKAKRLSSILALAVAGLVTPFAYGDADWRATVDSNWDNPANWSATPTGNLFVNITTPGQIATVSSTPTNVSPTDIRIGTGGSDGRVDVTAGTLSTGNGNWLFLGYQGGQATLNIANTSGTGGTFTGLAQGTGSFNAGGASQNGDMLIGLDANTRSTLNVNTTGTVAGRGLFLGANGASTGTLNLDSGTITLSGELQVGSNYYGNGGTGSFNMSGGTVTAEVFSIGRGGNGTAAITGTAVINAGTINTRQWLTLGFAGSANNNATLTNNGGTINVNTATGGNGVIEMGVFDATNNTFNAQSGNVNLQNNSSIVFGSGGNHSGTSTFTQSGGGVTFYGDGGTTVGGTGSINLGSGNSTGTYVYNLNGGTLTVPSIRKSGANANGTFNFNGGTLRAAGNNTGFITGLTAAVVQSGGANIHTNGFNVAITQNLSGTGAVTKLGAGTLTFNTSQDYTGSTAVSAGNLRLLPTATYASSGFTVASGATLSTVANAGNTAIAGSLNLNSGSTFDLRNGVVDTFSVFNGLTLSGATLGFDVGAGGDALALGGGSFSATGTNNIVLGNLGGATAGSTYNLLTGASGLSLSNFNLQTLSVGGLDASLSVVGGNVLRLTLSAGTGATAAYYNVNGNGAFAPASFSANANGTGTVSAIGATTAVTFSSALATSATAKTVTLSANQSVKSITVTDAGAITLGGNATLTIADTAGITVNSGAGAFTVNATGVALDINQVWTNNSANAAKIASVISGAGKSLNVAGAGGFVLTGVNTYDGATIIDSGAKLQLGDGTAGNDGSIASTSSVTNNGLLVYNRAGTGNTAAYVISGEGSVTVTGPGSQALTGVNTYTGGTNVNGGRVAINSAASLGGQTSPLNLNSGTLQTTANITTGRTINLSSTSTIQTDASTTYTLTGTLDAPSILNGDGSLTKTGAGVLRVTTANAYTGGTIVTAGEVRVGGNGTLGSGGITLNGGTLSGDNNGGVNFEPNITNPMTVGAGGGTIAIPAGTFTHFAGNISGSGSLTVGGLFNGSGLGLEGNNAGYTGTVTVINANTRLGNVTAGSAAANWVVNGNLQTNVVGGGTFNFGALSGTGSISGHANNPSAAVSTVRVGALNTSTTFSGIIVDNAANDAATGNLDGGANNILALTKVGTGTLTLTGANTYTGLTTVANGTLSVKYSSAGASAASPLLTGAAGADIQNGAVVFDYTGDTSPASTIRGLLASSFQGATTPGVMDSGQIRSSTATAVRGLGYRDDGAGHVTVKAALFGDADLDGGVSINDFNALAGNFGQSTGKVWTDGDFDYDGGVSINDFNLLAGGFGQSIPANSDMWAGLLAFAAAHNDLISFEAVTGVPEPTSLGLIAAAGVMGLRRKRRSR